MAMEVDRFRPAQHIGRSTTVHRDDPLHRGGGGQLPCHRGAMGVQPNWSEGKAFAGLTDGGSGADGQHERDEAHCVAGASASLGRAQRWAWCPREAELQIERREYRSSGSSDRTPAADNAGPVVFSYAGGGSPPPFSEQVQGRRLAIACSWLRESVNHLSTVGPPLSAASRRTTDPRERTSPLSFEKARPYAICCTSSASLHTRLSPPRKFHDGSSFGCPRDGTGPLGGPRQAKPVIDHRC